VYCAWNLFILLHSFCPKQFLDPINISGVMHHLCVENPVRLSKYEVVSIISGTVAAVCTAVAAT
jgi:hypothetical protein